MDRPGSALDNAVIESCHSTLEFELRSVEHSTTRAAARARVSAWIEDYNQYRQHSALVAEVPGQRAAGLSLPAAITKVTTGYRAARPGPGDRGRVLRRAEHAIMFASFQQRRAAQNRGLVVKVGPVIVDVPRTVGYSRDRAAGGRRADRTAAGGVHRGDPGGQG
jgi:hypothetical protein